ncbi:MAG: MATE family efflux transporter, partial [Lentisphaeria bacterium]
MSMVITGLFAVTTTLLGVFSASVLAKIFVGYDGELLSITTSGMQLFSLSFAICGFNVFASAFFTALNNGFLSSFISLLRTFVLQIIAILILPIFWGINGVWLSIVVAEAVTFIISLIIFINQRKQYQYA